MVINVKTMTQYIDENLLYIQSLIVHTKSLGFAIKKMHEYLHEHTNPLLLASLEEVENDYKLMKDYMIRGFHDPERADVYSRLLISLYNIVGDAIVNCLREKNPAYASSVSIAQGYSYGPEKVKAVLEGFVQNLAMASLESKEKQKELTQKLYSENHRYMSCLFSAVLVSRMWHDSTSEFYSSLIVSPTIDAINANVIISAIMLSCMYVFDINKLKTLISIYHNATDEHLRQRALVGFAFCLPMDDIDFFPQLKVQIYNMLDEKTCNELFELQRQIIYCKNADSDSEEIRRNVMPDILQNSHYNITHSGILENDDDSLRDILNPGAEDEAMEKMEQSFGRMMDMQKKGSDIYFGGFSQMKSYSFFYELVNWFCPFYAEHPSLGNVMGRFGDSAYLKDLFSTGPFCDSDKYSFALSISAIFDQMPPEVRKLISGKETIWREWNPDNNQSDTFIRRMYLQDLYRFFRLYAQKSCFINPFDSSQDNYRGLFFTNPLFSHSPLQKRVVELEKFLMKHRCDKEVSMVINSYKGEDNIDALRIEAVYNLKMGNYAGAGMYFLRVLQLNSDDEEALKGIAQCDFHQGSYETALETYEKLLKLCPNKKLYLLNTAITHIYKGIQERNMDKGFLLSGKVEDYGGKEDVEDGMKILFRLNYEEPDHVNVMRALAWGYLQTKGNSESFAMLRKINDLGRCKAEDYLNMGYCQWFLNMPKNAVESFRRYMSMNVDASLKNAFSEDSYLIDMNGIKWSEQSIMLDICS